MSRTKSSNAPGLQVLLEPHNPLVLAVEQTMLRGHEWSRSAAPVAEQIAVRLAGAIVRDRIRPGERLLEKDISEVLHVSRSPTREALRILERERLVDFEARRGAVVMSLTAQDLQDIFSVRGALYAIMFTQVMHERPDELAAQLDRHMPDIEKSAQGMAESYLVQSFLLNLGVVDLCSNRLIADLLTSISLRTLRHIRMGYLADPQGIARSVMNWRAVHRAVVRRDLAQVLKAVQERMEEARAAALESVRPPPSTLAQEVHEPGHACGVHAFGLRA